MMDGLQRPLSPFLIYRWGVSNGLSILHRASGVFLTLGLTVLVCWLVSLASGAESYARVAAFYSGGLFRLIFAAWALSFFYHLANGIRHLVWDAGHGFERSQILLGGILVVAFALIATLVYVATGLF